MKKTSVLILCLAILCQACLQIPDRGGTGPTDSQVRIIEEEEIHSGAVYELPVITIKARPWVCAVVSAEQALHVRQLPNERALVIGWLLHDERVRVLDSNEGEWWLIERADLVGYVNSNYLVKTTCEERIKRDE